MEQKEKAMDMAIKIVERKATNVIWSCKQTGLSEMIK